MKEEREGRPADFGPLEGFVEYEPAEMEWRARAYFEEMNRRRTVREFSERPVPREVIEWCLRTAGSAPSGANRQPWHFVAVGDAATKRQIRQAAEREEHAFYHGAAPQQWLEAVAPMGTDEQKPFLQNAPWLIVVFAERYGPGEAQTTKNYYVSESVGIATGLLLTALHHAGLATLTHTPSPMRFLGEILGRPARERAYLIVVAGYPAKGAEVPVLRRKSLDEIATFVE